MRNFLLKFIKITMFDPMIGSDFIPSYFMIIFLTQYRFDFLGMEGKVTT